MKLKSFIYLNTSFLFLLLSCEKTDCNNIKIAYYPDEYNLIVESSEIDDTWIKINGFSLLTNQKENIMVHNNWIFDVDELEMGDTIKKEKGKLPISIHKKNSVIMHDWYCNGKVYK
jgi:hypothetical protein